MSAVTPGLPSRSPPIQLPQRRNGRTRGGGCPFAPSPSRRRRRVATAGRIEGARPAARYRRGHDREQRRVEERHRRPRPRRAASGATVRRSDVRHRSVISSRSRRRTSRSSDGVRRGSSSRSSRAAQRRSATSAVRRRASVGCAVRTRRRPTGARAGRRALRRSARTGAVGDGLGDRIVEDAVARGTLAPPERPDPAPRLDEVDELEVQRECADDGLGRPEIEAAQVFVETPSLVGVVVVAQRDRASADALDELEQLRARLFRHDLAEQRAHQADLGRERVRGAGRADPGRFGPHGRRR